MREKEEKIAENEDLVSKRKATSVNWNYFGYMILTKHVFCVDIAVTRLICLTIYVDTTQLSTTKLGKISAG